MILTGLTRDSGEMYQTYFYQVLSVLEELQLCFRMLSLMGQQVWQTLLWMRARMPKEIWSENSWKAVNGHLSMQLNSQCCTRKHIKCWKNLSICCCHMKSWQISCPGTGTPHRRSLTGQGFQLQPESTLRKQCLCWEWFPPPASLWGCGQMVALSNGTEANLSLLLQWASVAKLMTFSPGSEFPCAPFSSKYMVPCVSPRRCPKGLLWGVFSLPPNDYVF